MGICSSFTFSQKQMKKYQKSTSQTLPNKPPSKQPLKSLVSFCCSPRQQLQNHPAQKSLPPKLHSIPLSDNITLQLNLEPVVKNIYTKGFIKPMELKLNYVKRENRESGFSSGEAILRERKMRNGFRDVNVCVQERQSMIENGEGDRNGTIKIFVNKDCQYLIQMSKLMQEIKDLSLGVEIYEISLQFDQKIVSLKHQILKNSLQNFLTLSPRRDTHYYFKMDIKKQSEIKSIQKICEDIKNSSLQNTEQFFKNRSKNENNNLQKTMFESNPQ